MSRPQVLIDDDSGLRNDDNITSIAKPRITVSAGSDSELLVQLDLKVLFTGNSPGTFLQQTSLLADGKYLLSATATDLAGNVARAEQYIAVDTAAPPPPTLNLISTSDSGNSGDNGRNLPTPIFSGPS